MDRHFARPEPPSTAPLPFAWALGTLFGGVGGLAAGAWETAMLRATGAPVSLGPHLFATVVAGAACGLLAGISGLYGPSWAVAATVLALGWLASAVVGHAVGWLGVGFTVAVSAVAAQIAGRLPMPPWLQQGLAAFGFVVVAVLAPLELHLVPSGTTSGSVGTALLVCMLGAAFAGLSGAFTLEGRAPWVPLVAAVVGGVGLHGVLSLRRDPGPLLTSSDRPSLILVSVSGLRADRMGFLGYPREPSITPVLDGLAAHGVAFEQAHATSNWTVPSLGSMLTGRWPYGHGAGLNTGRGSAKTPLRADVRTVPEVLHRAGVATAAAMADPTLRKYGFDHGFDRYTDDPGQGWPPTALAPLIAAGLDPWPRRASADRVVDEAVRLLHALPDHGAFLLVELADLGGPLDPSPDDLAAIATTRRPYRGDQYDATLRRVDRAIGRLMESVPVDAWVMVVGDRGLWLGESRPGARPPDPGTPFGGTMYEELLHVPLVVRAPGLSPVRERALVSVVDVGPTIWRFFGVETASPLDGAPLGPLFGEVQPARPVIAQSSLYGPEQQAILVGHQKLVQYGDRETPLFDLATDPTESSPLTPTGANGAGAERRLLSQLPPRAAGYQLADPPSMALQMGQITDRFFRGRR